MNFPQTPRRFQVTRLIVVALTAGALATAAIVTGGTTATGATRASAPRELLSITSAGGFVPADFDFSRLPTHHVTTDGAMLTQGPTTMIYPGPALPNIRVRTLNAAGISRLRSLVVSAGLDRTGADFGLPPTADVPALVIRYLDAKGRVVTNTIPSFGVGDEFLTRPQQARRAKVRALMTALDSADRTFGKRISADVAYTPTRFAIRASAPQPTADGLAPNVVDWPLPGTPLAGAAQCVLVEGRDAVTLGATLQRANQLTQFRDAGAPWRLAVRVVLPGAAGCP